MRCLNPAVVARRDECGVCKGTDFQIALDWEDLPITGRFSEQPMAAVPPGIDQKLLICSACGHAQLANQVDPAALYDDTYYFRTSYSQKAIKGTDFFLDVLDKIAGKKVFECVVDVGCNDLYLLKQLHDKAKLRIGIDPIWKSKEEEVDDKGIIVLGDPIEEIHLGNIVKGKPDLIVCRHTLEHIYNPREVVQKLFDFADDETLFLFEVPGFDGLVNRFRFDQIFHEHLQYFSLNSFVALIKELRGSYIGHYENWHEWGALVIAFRKKKTGDTKMNGQKDVADLMDDIRQKHAVFCHHMEATKETLLSFKGSKFYGYGAAQMLPVLAYHLRDDLSSLEAVLDDDPLKDGLFYWNLPLKIMHSRKVKNLSDANILITAVDNVQPILKKLLEERPLNIIFPSLVI